MCCVDPRYEKKLYPRWDDELDIPYDDDDYDEVDDDDEFYHYYNELVEYINRFSIAKCISDDHDIFDDNFVDEIDIFEKNEHNDKDEFDFIYEELREELIENYNYFYFSEREKKIVNSLLEDYKKQKKSLRNFIIEYNYENLYSYEKYDYFSKSIKKKLKKKNRFKYFFD